jgi:cell division protein FtsZ
VNQAAAIIKETAHPDVNLIFGAVIDQNMGDEIRITVIATGFERTGTPRRIEAIAPRQEVKVPRPNEVRETRDNREYVSVSQSKPTFEPPQ